MSSAVLPPSPDFVHGREDEVDRLVTLILEPKPARIAIAGAEGIGKTTVALLVLHDERVCERFGDHQYFISCQRAADADSVVKSLLRRQPCCYRQPRKYLEDEKR